MLLASNNNTNDVNNNIICYFLLLVWISCLTQIQNNWEFFSSLTADIFTLEYFLCCCVGVCVYFILVVYISVSEIDATSHCCAWYMLPASNNFYFFIRFFFFWVFSYTAYYDVLLMIICSMANNAELPVSWYTYWQHIM